MAHPVEAPRFDSGLVASPSLSEPIRILRYPRAVDILNGFPASSETNNPGVRYEEQRFRGLALALSDSELAIGPHLLDRAMGKEPQSKMARPDALRLTLQDQRLVLAQMLEFKSKKNGPRKALREKIMAFPRLLRHFRRNPGLLERLLNNASMNLLDIGEIVIPPNDQIRVHVVSVSRYFEPNPMLPFKTTYEQIPLED